MGKHTGTHACRVREGEPGGGGHQPACTTVSEHGCSGERLGCFYSVPQQQQCEDSPEATGRKALTALLCAVMKRHGAWMALCLHSWNALDRLVSLIDSAAV